MKTTTRTTTLICLALLAASLASASTTYNFSCITNNSGVCPLLAPQFSATATDHGTFVSFDISQAPSGLTAFISQVYFDDPSGYLSLLSIVNAGWSAGGTPASLPAGNNVGFVSSFLVSANPPSPVNGIHTGQDLILSLAVANGHTFTQAMTSGLELGLHVQGVQETSESLYSGKSSNAPEPSTVVLLGCGLLGLFMLRKRKGGV